MTKPLLLAALLPLALGACDPADDEHAELEALAAELADHVGIESYQVVVLEDDFAQSDDDDDDDDDDDVPPNASMPDELAADDEPVLACRYTGWIGHTSGCMICTVDWIWWGCVESVQCGGGSPTTYQVCEGASR